MDQFRNASAAQGRASSEGTATRAEFDRLRAEGGAFLSATQLTRTPILVTDASAVGDPIIFANAAFLSFFGYGVDELVGHEVEDMCDGEACEVMARLRAAVAEGRETSADIRLRRKDGSVTLTSAAMLRIDDKEGRLSHHFLSFIDRSELAAADAKLRDALAENARLVRELTQRDLLVAETNHRVKNTLMQAAMALMMEGARSPNPEVVDALTYARMRLEAMAGIYDLLSISDATRIDMGGFLATLAPHLVPSLMPVAVKTRLATDLFLPPETAQPLALVAVELVTNAVKHAFPSRRGGRIAVDLSRTEQGVVLVIADDGVGMPAGAADSLGYKLVRGLVRQVGGSLEIDTGATGTTVTVRVPETPAP